VAVLRSLLLDKNFRGEAYKFRKKLKEQPTALCSTAHSIQLCDVDPIVVEDFKFHVFIICLIRGNTAVNSSAIICFI